MNKENLRENKGGAVAEENLQDDTQGLVFVKLIKGDTTRFKQVSLNSEATTPLQRFLIRMREEALERIENISDEYIEVNKNKRHGRRRSSREITDERKQKRDRLKNRLGRLASAIQGDLEVPIMEVVVESGEFKSLKLAEVDDIEKDWWRRVNEKGLDFSSLREIDTGAPEILLEMYTLRKTIDNSMYTDVIEQAKKRYNKLLSETSGELKDELARLFKNGD